MHKLAELALRVLARCVDCGLYQVGGKRLDRDVERAHQVRYDAPVKRRVYADEDHQTWSSN